ncbi:MAG: nucleotide exchange factor GrpE [archaeon]
MTAADEPEEAESSTELVAEVTAHDEELGAAVADLESRVAELEATVGEKEEEIETLTERLQRTQADFQNYKKRAKERQADAERRATRELLERFLSVRDDLGRALEDESNDLESLKEGVRVTRNEFDRVLDAEGVVQIDPEPGTAVDPTRHEVMMRVESDQPADTVASVYRKGYETEEAVLRTAQVTVSEGPAEASDDENTEATGDEATDAADASDDAAE